MLNEWVEEQAEFLRTLTGCCVVRWHAIEMALRDVGPDGLPHWRDVSIPFLQLNRLDLALSDGRSASIITYQNDDRWGLCRTDAIPPSRRSSDEPGSIFRSRVLDGLPMGQIRHLSVRLNESDIAEVRLHVEDSEVRLWAGEVYEQCDGSLWVATMDESVLVQVNGKHPEAT